MKKICRNCNLFYDEDDIICCECGKPLEDYTETGTENKNNLTGPSIQQDNRIHRGDKINVGGDNFNAQSVDKRTVTNTTTINNIQNIVDESKALVKCEISGKRIHKIDSYECPVCKRTVAPEYYVVEKRMCVLCAEESGDSLQNSNTAQKPQPQKNSGEEKVIPPMIETANATPSQIFIPPIEPSGRKSSKGVATVCVIAVAAVIGIWLWTNNSGESDTQVDETAVESPTAPADIAETMEQTKQTEQAEPQSTPKSSSSKTRITAEETADSKAQEPTETVENNTKELSLYDKGKEAYDTKEYGTAAVLLKQAMSSNPKAGYYLSLLYQKGLGVSKSVKDAFSYMKQAAEGGCTDAYYDLAEMYKTGVGTEPNRTLAKKWYEQCVLSSAKNSDKAAKELSKYN